MGGIDFGWRNPFAALCGVLDGDDVLWIGWERYLRETPLHLHAAALRQHKGVVWYADPAGRTEIEELRAAGLAVRRADNDIRLGIAAVAARLRTGRLKVHGPACPQLLAEARLYRYPTATERAPIERKPGGRTQSRPWRPALSDCGAGRAVHRPAAEAAGKRAAGGTDQTCGPTDDPDLWTALT